MSLNRELVEFYIQYKLSQRGFPTEHLGLGERRSEGRRRDRSRTEEQTQEEQQEEEEQQQEEEEQQHEEEEQRDTHSTEAGASSDSHYNGSVNGSSPAAPLDPASPPLALVKEALRDSAVEFELRFSRAFSDLQLQLHLTPASAYRSFESVMDEVFRDGVNWGRVVGLFAFGGALCVECVDKEMSPLVVRIMHWMTVYLDQHIQDWITEQGGWARFAEIYGQDAAAQSRRSQETFKKWLFAGVTLVTGVVVGSLLAQRRL